MHLCKWFCPKDMVISIRLLSFTKDDFVICLKGGQGIWMLLRMGREMKNEIWKGGQVRKSWVEGSKYNVGVLGGQVGKGRVN